MYQAINQLKTNLFTGRLNLEARDGPTWTLYFRLGRLIWQTGGPNSDERWRRHLLRYCPHLDFALIEQIVPQQDSYREYRILAQLQEQKLIEQQQLVNLITSTIAEVLFDVMQYSEGATASQQQQLSCTTVVGEVPSFLLAVVSTEEVLKQATQAWKQWRDAGLSAYSPNLFPVVQQFDHLQLEASFQPLISLVDGTQTLRSLAQKSGQDVLSLTLNLMPLVKVGAIAFSSVPSFRKYNLPTHSQENITFLAAKSEEDTFLQVSPNWRKTAPTKTGKQIINPSGAPLVACVDDSPVVCRRLEEILTQHSYRFVGIQESLTAVFQLIKSKPDFIFLDLLMPKMNGYEICSQIRKTPSLRDVPVVILTGKDGLVDRMRAKLVGATDFLSKPVETEKVLHVLHRHLVV